MSQELIKTPSFKTEKDDYKFENLLSKRNVKIAAFVLGLIAAGVIAYKVLERDAPNQYGDAFESTNPPIEQQVDIDSGSNQEFNTVVNNSEQQNNSIEQFPTVEQLEISDLSLMQKPEELVKTFLKLQEDWLNSGATKDNAQKSIASGYNSHEDYAQSIVAPSYDAIYEKAIFSKSIFEDKKKTYSDVYIDRLEAEHVSVLNNNFITSFPDTRPDDKEPYKIWYELKSLQSWKLEPNEESGERLLVDYTRILKDNSDQNVIGTVDKSSNDIKTTVLGTVFQVEDGKIKIAVPGTEHQLNK